MRLELSELIACPVCGPPRVMVAVVREAAGPRVHSGFLGCPSCEARFPIEGGALYLSKDPGEATPAGRTVGPAGAGADAHSAETIMIAAVLGLGEGSGCALVGPGLARMAAGIAEVAGGWEILSLVEAGGAKPGDPENLSRVIISGLESPPVLAGRFPAVAVKGDGAPARVAAYASCLAPLGRLAVVRPGPGSAEAVLAAGLRVVVSDARVILASRED